MRSTYNLLLAAAQHGVKNIVYLSSLAIMTGYPEDLAVDEDWRPLAKGDSPGLAEYLGEVVCREFAREGKIHAVVLRLGNVVQGEGDRRAALRRAPGRAEGRRPGGLVGAGGAIGQEWPSIGGMVGVPHPVRLPAGPIFHRKGQTLARLPPTIGGRRPMNVLLIGACGYLGPHVAKALAPRHRLRITDIRPPSAVIKRELGDHEFRIVDVTEPDQVREAAKGMDAIVNLSVVRNHPVQAFRVNVLGCQNVMQAAVRQGHPSGNQHWPALHRRRTQLRGIRLRHPS